MDFIYNVRNVDDVLGCEKDFKYFLVMKCFCREG